MSEDFATISWLRRLATEAGKGVVNNIDGRTLGRVADRLEAMNAQVESAAHALTSVRKIISEGAMTGFNCHDGDWAQRLFESQQVTSAALKLFSSTQSPKD